MSVDRIASDAMAGGVLEEFLEIDRQSGPMAAPQRRSHFAHVVLLTGCLLGGVIAWRHGGQSPVAATQSGSFSHVGFVPNEQLAPMIAFTPLDAIRAPLHYEARTRESPQERWDTLTYGDIATDETFFRVTLRSAKSGVSRPTLFVDIAKQSAEIGAAVMHATNPQIFATERGPIEWAEMSLSGLNGDRSCLGFRFNRPQDFDLSGLACGAHGATLDRTGLERLIQRLSVTGSGMAAGLGDVLKSGAT
jgi:hypothetical protein